ncbi:hypothetical protein Taro_029229, partial [Colocasia esculenta]|nr:hypothetical protein [Colocasia esculenta]
IETAQTESCSSSPNPPRPLRPPSPPPLRRSPPLPPPQKLQGGSPPAADADAAARRCRRFFLLPLSFSSPFTSSVRNEMSVHEGEKTEKLSTTQQQQQLEDEISWQQIHRYYSLPINVDDDEEDEDYDNLDPEFTVVARASRRSYAEEDDRQRGMGTSRPHLPRDDVAPRELQ